MNSKYIICSTIVLVFTLAIHFTLPNTYADNSTQTLYCNNGVCSTGGTQKPLTNSSQGLYSPGLYTGGVSIQNAQRIGIQLSQTCLKMAEYNITSNCLSYKTLKNLDTTNPFYSGQWVATPYYHRLAPKVIDAYKFNTNNFVVMVDPDALFTTKARMIIVTNNNFTYVNPDETSKGGLVTISHINRFVAACELATVAPIPSLVNDTLKYMESGCTKTNYNDAVITYHKDIPFDYNNPYSSLHYDMAKLKANMHQTPNCITKKCDTPKDPYKKTAWK